MLILLAEDDGITAMLMQHTFHKKTDYTITLAKDGCEAIDFFDTETFDLVITDIMMPKKEGCDVVHHIREVRKSDTPIIIQTALDHQLICEGKIDKYNIAKVFTKPIDLDIVIHFIRNCINA